MCSDKAHLYATESTWEVQSRVLLSAFCSLSYLAPGQTRTALGIQNMAFRRDDPTCEQHQDLLCDGTALVSGSGPGCFLSYNPVATQSYSGILFPVEVHLVLFCK